MRAFLIYYNGINLGGMAVVIAKNEDDAIETLFPDEEERKREEPEVSKSFTVTSSQIVFNWDGDY